MLFETVYQTKIINFTVLTVAKGFHQANKDIQIRYLIIIFLIYSFTIHVNLFPISIIVL
jgi:hypothetical protein